MHSIIDHQLRLSRLRTRSSSDSFASPLKENAAKTVAALKRTPEGKPLNWEVNIPEHIRVDIDVPDLYELFGIILENAGFA